MMSDVGQTEAQQLQAQQRVRAAITSRLADLGWKEADFHAATGIAPSTIRALSARVQTTRPTTKRATERGIGWTTGSWDRAAAGLDPEIDPHWQPFAAPAAASREPDSDRIALSRLNLAGDDKAEALHRYDIGDAWIREMASIVASFYADGIEGEDLDTLLAAAANGIRAGLAALRRETQQLAGMRQLVQRKA
jgi:hypothetical protein